MAAPFMVGIIPYQPSSTRVLIVAQMVVCSLNSPTGVTACTWGLHVGCEVWSVHARQTHSMRLFSDGELEKPVSRLIKQVLQSVYSQSCSVSELLPLRKLFPLRAVPSQNCSLSELFPLRTVHSQNCSLSELFPLRIVHSQNCSPSELVLLKTVLQTVPSKQAVHAKQLQPTTRGDWPGDF